MGRHLRIHCLLIAGILLAQSQVAAERFKWWQSTEVQKALHLTQKQVAALDSIFNASLPQRRALRAAFDRCESDFEELQKQSMPDELIAVAAIDRLEKARARRNVARTMLLLRMRRILTAVQRRVLDDIAAQRH